MAAGIAHWLEGLGLGEYKQAFIENSVELDHLRHLTDDDLKDLGVPLGPRRRLQAAIQNFPPHVSSIQSNMSTKWTSNARSTEAERRQLTVMFVDLVGSTALSTRLDPEDMRDVLRAYQNAVAGEVSRFGGYIAKFMGDGVLTYFGWPKAHEDEAEQAVRASLAVRDAVSALIAPDESPLSARIGLATGLVVVGDLVGEGAAQEEAVIGDPPNLAARLQGFAEPGQVVIAEATRQLVGHRFELVELGQLELKGLSQPILAFTVMCERQLESRFEARSGHLLSMVGRDQELALILDRWALAKSGEGQGLLLVGEAGIGKSRITRALLDAIFDEPHTRIRYQCSPYHQGSALWPVIQHLLQAASIASKEPVEKKIDRLEKLLAKSGTVDNDSVHLIADLIGLDTSVRYTSFELTPQARRARTLAALTDQWFGLAGQLPVLVILEDAHWIDPTTLELIERGLEKISDASVLLLLTSRPENQPTLPAHPHVTHLSLNRLGRAGVETIVGRLGGKQLPDSTVDTIIARTDGVPLFVEELTKAVIETGEDAIPASLHDSLIARLDNIPEAKEVAQIAACIGRVFEYELLAMIADKEKSELGKALAMLTQSELIFRRASSSNATYIFKHALVRDAAYQSLLRPRRRDLHGRIANILERRPRTMREPEDLAQHFTEAGLFEEATSYLLEAGEHAAMRCANLEAITHLTRGLELLGQLTEPIDRTEQELKLRVILGGALIATKGYPAPEVENNCIRAAELCERHGHADKLVPVLRQLWSCYFARGELQHAFSLAERIVELTGQQDTKLQAEVSGRVLAPTLLLRGQLSDACAAFEHARFAEHRNAPRDGENPGVFTKSYAAWARWFKGFPDRAVRTADEALALGVRDPHPFSHAIGLTFAAFLHNWRGDFTQARNQATQSLAVAAEARLPLVLAFGTMAYGQALCGLGQKAEGLEKLRVGHSDWATVGAHLMDTQFFAFIAEAEEQTGQFRKALETLDQATLIAATTGEAHYESELLRLRAVVFIQLGQNTKAEELLICALNAAKTQSAKSFELRAAYVLARFWIGQGKRDKARELLQPIYDWFTEGFDTTDLQDTKALLDDLA